ncbi:serine/threonine protein kinase [Micromonospora kangleipakensis]|uniref:non-specific serine/threonine protein kinase n=1 Tax=Micromonospora kangleipakensis TaxID=1077942 RepID=A0A4Q8BG35_9ACTN|nr:serine/threonine-protein kinase [Micromonospora kangleipakensis]RZU76947.1 serine/threonine protein kinase [Micromonospora kangleipakensis]
MLQLLVAGRYRLLDQVGSGGMGRVWLARDEMLHRDVAVKEVVPPAWLTEPERDELRLRTLREARTAARLNHPNVVRIYDVVHDRGSPWIVMEYVPSRSIQELLNTDGPFPPRRAAEIGLAVLAALRAAHAAGVLHRDVKPHNVLVAHDGRVVLTDFGLATFVGGDGAMTGPGLVLGSPQFVAPERARDGISDPRTDLWSLGATLYAAVEGQSPYARGSAMATLSALATDPPDPIRRAGPLRPALEGLLQREPWRRLTAAEVEPLLRAAATTPGEPPGATEGADAARRTADRPGPPRPAVRRRRQRWAALGAAVALLAAAGTVLALGGPDDRPPAPGVGGGSPAARPAAFACAAPPPAGATPVRSAPAPTGERFGLIPDWTWYVDPSGFRIAAPVNWLRWTDGGVTCLREPGGSRLLSVGATAAPADPVAYWRAEERRLTGDGLLADYRRVEIGPIDMFRAGALWECGWVTGAGDKVHSARLVLAVAPGRAYTVSWLTKEFDWQVNATYFLMIRQSFRPGP